MHKLTLNSSRQITQQLSYICANRPKACKKDGAMGWVSNQRIIIVRRGYFQYYNLHSGFVEDDPLSINERYFKAAIRLDLIQEMNYLPRNKTRKVLIELVFSKDKIMKRQPMEAQVQEQQPPERALYREEIEKWVFQFKIDIKEYVEQKRQEYRQQKRKMARIEPPIVEVMKGLGLVSNSATQLEDDLEKNIEEYVESVQKTKEFLRSKAQIAEQEAARLRRKKEKEKTDLVNSKSQSLEDTYLISPFWREYFKMLEQVLQDKDRANRILTEIKMLKLIESFNEVASKIVKCYVEERGVGWDGAKKNMAGFNYYQGLWLRVGGKQLNHQFLVNYNINDIFYSLSEIKNMKFRLPLMSLIQYRGLKVLVMCDMPFSELKKSQIYNLLTEGFDLQLMGKIKEALEVIEDTLNVRSQPAELDQKRNIMAPLGLNLRIFQYNIKKDNPQDQITLPNFYYVINIGNVFPLDFNTQQESNQPLARLRPEFVAAYRDYVKESPQLLSQAFMVSSMGQESKKQEDEKVIKASGLLVKHKVKELIDKLNRVDLLLVDSYSLKTMMHEMGINVRYLYLIYNFAEIPYIREHILADALARTIKKEFRSALSQLEQQKLDYHHSEFLRMRNNERLLTIRDKIEEAEQVYREIALDYLNLIFGKGQQTEEFWKIIIRKCQLNYKIAAQYPPKIKPGLLLHAVLWQCGLNAKFDKNIPLFKADRPFSQPQQVNYRLEVKTYDFPSFEIQKLFRSAPSIDDQVTTEVYRESTQKLLKLQLLFFNSLKFNFQAATAISKMHHYNQFLAKLQLQNPMHPVVLPFYLSNKSQYNFHRALDIIAFSLPDTHPLYVSVYNEYSSIMEPQLLKRTALMMAVKCFGQYHVKTTQLYSMLYHEGNAQYGVKARRIQTIEACSVVCREIYQDQKYEMCLRYVEEQIENIKEPGGTKIGTANYQKYITMLIQGLESAIRTIQLNRGIAISVEVSNVISAFKVKDLQLTYDLFRKVLVIHLLLCPKKYFLYKMVLLAVHIRLQHEKVQLDSDRCTAPVDKDSQMEFIEGLSQEYYTFENHSNWVKHVIDTLLKSFQYFNFLEDLFNNYAAHIRRFNNQTWRQCLGFWDILIRIYGQSLFKSTLYDVRFN